ncbi:predicted protein [Naegleria gruberi]|uniref:Predicted protein n=1 Tax=Naegleria gruberi TaxID=5762 RepID=D2VCA1_NAEGR|nr:uncharacterized protein NAEGRDRAFT_66498 [Naegleria gruberi]EFC45715.1 predicted protein [Naegleria gruberi]|eukprot:XP_002678459.1 predicted protein [Naegleria gruberi strain NEG-M]
MVSIFDLWDHKPAVLAIFSIHFKEKRQPLRAVSNRLRNDKEVVMAAFEKDYLQFKYASSELRADREFVLLLARSFGDIGLVLEYISSDLTSDKDFVSDLFEADSKAFEFFPSELRSDKDFVLKIIAKSNDDLNLEFLRHLSDNLKADKEIVLKAVFPNEYSTQQLDIHLNNDREIALTAVRKERLVFRFLSKELQSDEEIQKYMIDSFGNDLVNSKKRK